MHPVQKNEIYIVLTIQGTSKEVKLTTLNLTPGDTQKVATISWREGEINGEKGNMVLERPR